MSTPAISALEQNIRQKAGDDAVANFADSWANTFRHHWDAKLTRDESEVLESVKLRLMEATKKAAGDQAVRQFLITYRNLVQQFPDLVDQPQEESA